MRRYCVYQNSYKESCFTIKMAIHFGPAGLGPVKDAVKNLEEFSKKGLDACEITFTYGVYIKDEKDMKAIKEALKK